MNKPLKKHTLKLVFLATIALLGGCGAAPEQSPESNLSGTPDQDPIVASYRLALQTATSVSAEHLKSGELWTCRYRAAYKNDYREGIETYAFKQAGPVFQNYGSGAVKTFVIAYNGLMGNAQNYQLVFRSTGENAMVGEWTVANGFFAGNYSVKAVSNPSRRAYGYTYCQVGF